MTHTKDYDKDDIEFRLANGESLRSVAQTLGITHQALQYHRRKWGGKPLRSRGAVGTSHHSWAGGEYIDRWGYRMVRAPHRGMSNPYVAEHVLIAEEKIGRQLKKNVEVVHHINGNKLDNRLDNLLVRTRSEHRSLHAQLEALAFEFVRDGAISFVDGKYQRA